MTSNLKQDVVFNLRMQSFNPTADLGAAIELLLACRMHRPTDHWPTAQELRLLMSSSSSDNATASLWVNESERPVGFGRWTISGSTANLMLFAEKQTDYRVDRLIVEWALVQAKAAGHLLGGTVKVFVRPTETDVGLISVLDDLGFTREDWHVARLTRSLDDPIPEPVLPSGFTVRPVVGESDIDAYVALHRDAFGTELMTVAERLDFMRSPTYLPALDLVAVAPDGVLAAFAVGSLDSEENGRRGSKEGWTDPVGTRPAFQRKGLARALLLAAFRRLKEQGVSTAISGTGSWNAPMLRLAESVRFRMSHRVLAYTKVIVRENPTKQRAYIKSENPFDELAEDAIEEYQRGETKKLRVYAKERDILLDVR